MPRIDPLSLLKCLSVLLGPNGGIKSKEEVIRLANLMTKFSKKLVSKCIYIQILKSTESGLLDQFMGAGGWNLIHMWLTDGILAKNWALIQELLELLLLCPVDTNRLKSNHCPKLIKGLSKEGSHHGVRTLASRLVEQWLKMVKGEAMPQTEAVQAASVGSLANISNSAQPNASITPVTSQNISSENATSIKTSDSPGVHSSPATCSFPTHQEPAKNASLSKTLMNNSSEKPQVISTSVYKITIRDGKEVLTQVQTDAANINNIIGVNNLEIEVKGGVGRVHLAEEDSKFTDKSESNVQRTYSVDKNKVESESKDASNTVKDGVARLNDETDSVKSRDIKNEKDVISDGSKSTSDKENRDKRDDKKGVSSDKKSSHLQSSSKSSSKHGSSSNKYTSTSSKSSSSSQRSSSKSSSSSMSRDKSSKDKEKDRYNSSSSSKSSSSKSKTDRDREREKEKEKQKKDQAEKDKATLEKVQSQSLTYKIGKIPKKKSDEEKSEDSSKKSSVDSKDSKDKKSVVVTEKKKISISIENRKNSQDSTSRPKTVKTFNSKFRSTGLEEEVKPPPPRGSKKPTSVPDKKVTPPPKFPLKRSSPIKDLGPLDKKAKLIMDSPPTDEKKGGIKLIPAKPKCTYIFLILLSNTLFLIFFVLKLYSREKYSKVKRYKKKKSVIVLKQISYYFILLNFYKTEIQKLV
ncbi:serine/threonine-protein kinase fray2 [Copidosoma floridanum]|uniref:serine/threonine-protein kinase fray2 n=1 Tax=Copidosoma floridanum TaxID=29053 RepID=UPI0006C9695B|nr:serine/threonine-protein kinase fray2 [Copidosoma floridanum]